MEGAMFRIKASASKSVTDTAASAALGEGDQIIFANVGDEVVYVALGGSGVAATTNSTAVLPGQYIFADRDGAGHVSYICASSKTSTLNYTTAYKSR
jgi:hypothetical protein